MKRGFTLIELLVVIGIIGILAAIVVVSMSGGTDKARITKGQAFSAKIGIELADSLISEWRFDEGVDAIVNDAWGVNSGTLEGDPIWMSGGDCVSGSCLDFDGTGDYIDCGDSESLNISNTITIEAWVYSANFAQTGMIIQKQPVNERYQFFFDGAINGLTLDGGGHVTTCRTDQHNPILPINNTWHHIVGVISGTTGWIYVDGNQWATGIVTAIGTGVATDLLIGCYDPTHYLFSGLIDEVKIYSSAEDFAQIQSNYLVGLQKLFSKGAISQKEYNQRIKKIVLE